MNISRRDFIQIILIGIASIINISCDKRKKSKNKKDYQLNEFAFQLSFPVYFPSEVTTKNKKDKEYKSYLPLITNQELNP